MIKQCLQCKREFNAIKWTCQKRRPATFCSSACYGLAMKKRIIPARRYWLGKKRDLKTRNKIRLAAIGRIPWNKGKKDEYIVLWSNEAKKKWKLSWAAYREKIFTKKQLPYRRQHKYIEKFLGKPDTCEQCLLSGLSGHQIHWANKSGQYKQKLTDWLRLCVKCHGAYDKQKRLVNQLYPTT